MKRKRRLPLAPTLPAMQCVPGCGDCCGPVPVDQGELDAILQYAAQHHVYPAHRGLLCPYFQRGACQVYPVRPRVCRAYGHDPGLVCAHGRGALAEDAAAVRRWVLGDGKQVGLLPLLVLGRDPLSSSARA